MNVAALLHDAPSDDHKRRHDKRPDRDADKDSRDRARDWDPRDRDREKERDRQQLWNRDLEQDRDQQRPRSSSYVPPYVAHDTHGRSPRAQPGLSHRDMPDRPPAPQYPSPHFNPRPPIPSSPGAPPMDYLAEYNPRDPPRMQKNSGPAKASYPNGPLYTSPVLTREPPVDPHRVSSLSRPRTPPQPSHADYPHRNVGSPSVSQPFRENRYPHHPPPPPPPPHPGSTVHTSPIVNPSNSFPMSNPSSGPILPPPLPLSKPGSAAHTPPMGHTGPSQSPGALRSYDDTFPPRGVTGSRIVSSQVNDVDTMNANALSGGPGASKERERQRDRDRDVYGINRDRDTLLGGKEKDNQRSRTKKIAKPLVPNGNVSSPGFPPPADYGASKLDPPFDVTAKRTQDEKLRELDHDLERHHVRSTPRDQREREIRDGRWEREMERDGGVLLHDGRRPRSSGAAPTNVSALQGSGHPHHHPQPPHQHLRTHPLQHPHSHQTSYSTTHPHSDAPPQPYAHPSHIASHHGTPGGANEPPYVKPKDALLLTSPRVHMSGPGYAPPHPGALEMNLGLSRRDDGMGIAQSPPSGGPMQLPSGLPYRPQSPPGPSSGHSKRIGPGFGGGTPIGPGTPGGSLGPAYPHGLSHSLPLSGPPQPPTSVSSPHMPSQLGLHPNVHQHQSHHQQRHTSPMPMHSSTPKSQIQQQHPRQIHETSYPSYLTQHQRSNNPSRGVSPMPEPPISHLGMFVFPKTPFPYFISSSSNSKTGHIPDRDIRATILIPSAFLPAGLPAPGKARIWGGGFTAVVLQTLQMNVGDGWKFRAKDRPGIFRRIYTDDSDIVLCALHAGRITWRGVMKAKEKGLDLRLEFKVVKKDGRYIGGSGAMEGREVDEKDVDVGLEGLGITDGMTTRFGGSRMKRDESERRKGWSNGDTGEHGENTEGFMLQSASWGNVHDGSGIEVLSAQWIPRGTAHSLGLKNRSQRLCEYGKRRGVIMTQGSEPAGNELEDQRMRENSFTLGAGTGLDAIAFKYSPSGLRDALFPVPARMPLPVVSLPPEDRPKRRKRRKVQDSSKDEPRAVNTDMDDTDSVVDGPASVGPSNGVQTTRPKRNLLMENDEERFLFNIRAVPSLMIVRETSHGQLADPSTGVPNSAEDDAGNEDQEDPMQEGNKENQASGSQTQAPRVPGHRYDIYLIRAKKSASNNTTRTSPAIDSKDGVPASVPVMAEATTNGVKSVRTRMGGDSVKENNGNAAATCVEPPNKDEKTKSDDVKALVPPSSVPASGMDDRHRNSQFGTNFSASNKNSAAEHLSSDAVDATSVKKSSASRADVLMAHQVEGDVDAELVSGEELELLQSDIGEEEVEFRDDGVVIAAKVGPQSDVIPSTEDVRMESPTDIAVERRPGWFVKALRWRWATTLDSKCT